MRTFPFDAAFRASAFIAGLALVGCSSSALKSGSSAPTFDGLGAGSESDLSAASSASGAKDQDGVGIGVNAFLWRGALDTIGFMPLISADPFGGVIITDWYSPPGVVNERFKASVYILSRALRSDAIRMNINRQVLQNGQWVGAEVAPSTVADLENKVLATARRMRSQTRKAS